MVGADSSHQPASPEGRRDVGKGGREEMQKRLGVIIIAIAISIAIVIVVVVVIAGLDACEMMGTSSAGGSTPRRRRR